MLTGLVWGGLYSDTLTSGRETNVWPEDLGTGSFPPHPDPHHLGLFLHLQGFLCLSCQKPAATRSRIIAYCGEISQGTGLNAW